MSSTFVDFYASMHGGQSVAPTGLGYVPIVIEQSGRGERSYDIYSACCASASSFWWARFMTTRPT